jgi:membrane protein implicated in regulation of membrane protease activity
MPWWGWAVLAAVLGAAEMHVPGAYFIWIALGAAATCGADAFLELSLEAQIFSFALASAISCAVGYFVYRYADLPRRGEHLNQRDLLMVGARGIVFADIVNGQGKVKLGDTVWIAEGPSLSEGDPVIVRSVRGSRVVVERA